MSRETRIFISYKTGEDDGLNFIANTIRQYLEKPAPAKNGSPADKPKPVYKVFMDVTSLKAGEPWSRQIYDEIPQSDILLLLITGKTAESDWVNREVDYAKGARVTILPVLTRRDFDIKAALERFDLQTLQYVKLLNGTEAELEDLVTAIEELKSKTRQTQKDWLDKLVAGRRGKPHEPNQEYAVYTYKAEADGKKPREFRIYLAAGNMFDMKDIDVYVNTENDYMQMARVFDSTKTISALIRYYGSYLDDAGRILQDTVQDELDLIIDKNPEFKTRPVGLGTVIATSAGHPKSVMRTEHKARYVFHAATVSVVGEGPDKYMDCVLNEASIKRCVRKALQKVIDVNQAKGVIAPEGTPEHEEQQKAAAKYKPLESLILPIFGAGHGGRPSEEIIPGLVKGVKEFLVDHAHDPDFTLERIYMSAYLAEDVNFMKAALDNNFTPPEKPAGN